MPPARDARAHGHTCEREHAAKKGACHSCFPRELSARRRAAYFQPFGLCLADGKLEKICGVTQTLSNANGRILPPRIFPPARERPPTPLAGGLIKDLAWEGGANKVDDDAREIDVAHHLPVSVSAWRYLYHPHMDG